MGEVWGKSEDWARAVASAAWGVRAVTRSLCGLDASAAMERLRVLGEEGVAALDYPDAERPLPDA